MEPYDRRYLTSRADPPSIRQSRTTPLPRPNSPTAAAAAAAATTRAGSPDSNAAETGSPTNTTTAQADPPITAPPPQPTTRQIPQQQNGSGHWYEYAPRPDERDSAVSRVARREVEQHLSAYRATAREAEARRQAHGLVVSVWRRGVGSGAVDSSARAGGRGDGAQRGGVQQVGVQQVGVQSYGAPTARHYEYGQRISGRSELGNLNPLQGSREVTGAPAARLAREAREVAAHMYALRLSARQQAVRTNSLLRGGRGDARVPQRRRGGPGQQMTSRRGTGVFDLPQDSNPEYGRRTTPLDLLQQDHGHSFRSLGNTGQAGPPRSVLPGLGVTPQQARMSGEGTTSRPSEATPVDESQPAAWQSVYTSSRASASPTTNRPSDEQQRYGLTGVVPQRQSLLIPGQESTRQHFIRERPSHAFTPQPAPQDRTPAFPPGLPLPLRPFWYSPEAADRETARQHASSAAQLSNLRATEHSCSGRSPTHYTCSTASPPDLIPDDPPYVPAFFNLNGHGFDHRHQLRRSSGTPSSSFTRRTARLLLEARQAPQQPQPQHRRQQQPAPAAQPAVPRPTSHANAYSPSISLLPVRPIDTTLPFDYGAAAFAPLTPTVGGYSTAFGGTHPSQPRPQVPSSTERTPGASARGRTLTLTRMAQPHTQSWGYGAAAFAPRAGELGGLATAPAGTSGPGTGPGTTNHRRGYERWGREAAAWARVERVQGREREQADVAESSSLAWQQPVAAAATTSWQSSNSVAQQATSALEAREQPAATAVPQRIASPLAASGIPTSRASSPLPLPSLGLPPRGAALALGAPRNAPHDGDMGSEDGVGDL